jgi:hypothetical protein
MCSKSMLVSAVVLVVSLVVSVSAQLPPGWTSEDVGSPAPGSASESGGTWEITANGNDIWGTGDNFHYVYQPLEGDGEIFARVVDTGTGSNAWAKGGVMIRQDNTAGSAYAIVAVTGSSGGGACFQYRDNANAGAAWPGQHVSGISAPYWIKLVREGDSFTSYLSTDGVDWQPSGADPHSVSMTGTVLIGLCATSHANGELRTFTFDNVVVGKPVKARSPSPANEAIRLDTWVTLNWSAGHTAASHDVYFGESFEDVNDGTGDAFRVNQAETMYIMGFPGFSYPDGLVPGTTYYWRIDEVEADGVTKYKGDVWSFFVPPKTAYEPVPADRARYISTDTMLEWTPGFNAKLHYVYFGDDPNVVANATGGAAVTDATYDPGLLELGTTYYWRVDEFDPPVTHRGDVWSFSTLPDIPIADPSLVGWWKLDEGAGSVALDYSGHGNHGELQGDPQWVEGPDGGALEFDGTGDYVNCGNGPDLNITANLTLMCWIKVEAFTKTWETIVGRGDNSYRMSRGPGDGDSIHFGANGTGSNLNANTIVTTNTWRHVALVYDGTDKVVYIDGVEDARLPSPGAIDTSTYDLYIGANSQQSNRNLTGLVDDVRLYNKALTVEEIANAMRGDTTLAGNPSPRSGALVDVKVATALTWLPGDNAVKQDVYLSTDRAAVEGADASDTTGVYRGQQNGTSYTPAEGFPWGTGPWFWRVDQVNNDGTIGAGRIWSFTVADFLIVETFEAYTDNDAANEAIWQHWIDGFGVNTNGSQVGYVMPPYAEKSIVQVSGQSMPLHYNNTAGVTNSEAELKLTARNWTDEGVTALSIWLHGRPGSTGSFAEGPVGTFAMTGSGADIWGSADRFHFAYKTLTGVGSIQAQILSVENTNAWAKAGVMIRETLEPGSKFAGVYVTPTATDGSATNGVRFQARIDADTDAVSDSSVATDEQKAIIAPYWVKLERDVAGNFSGYYSTNGTSWTPMAWSPQNIQMGSTVYVGLALTSHDAALTSEAGFSNVTTTGNVAGQWINQDIGIDSNAAEPLYVAISNATGAPAIVVNDDPAAPQIETWTEWTIDLSKFSDQGINLVDVDKIAIGLGAKGGAAAGGSGLVYIDDITLRRP